MATRGKQNALNRRRRVGVMPGIFGTIAVVALVLVLAGTAFADEPSGAMCQTDADCKLIYSSCSCVGVPVSDPRLFLPANIDCAVNACRVQKIHATCVENTCEPAATPEFRTSSNGAARR